MAFPVEGCLLISGRARGQLGAGGCEEVTPQVLCHRRSALPRADLDKSHRWGFVILMIRGRLGVLAPGLIIIQRM